MDNTAKLAIYEAQVKNVRELTTTLKQVHRSINSALRSNDKAGSEAFTKIYALLFCSWAEATFSKIIHTPYGFDLAEIEQIKIAKSNGVAEGWKKCFELGLRHLDSKRGNFQPNAKKKMEAFIKSHVFDPSLLRNKLAHGQWIVALNRDNDKLNPELSALISGLDVVKVSAWIEGHKILSELVETLIESPKKAFMRDWDSYVISIESQISVAEARSFGDHLARLKAKDSRTGAMAKRHNR